MKNRKILSLFLALTMVLVTVLSSARVYAGSGEINVMGLLRVPFEFYINDGKTVEETLPDQNIKSTSQFDNKEKTRQAIVNAPSDGGRFDFDAIFKMKQSAGALGRTLWGQLGGKKTSSQVNGLPTGYEESKTESYIDLVVNIDEKITPAQTISVYFDSHTWRPTFIYDAETKELLGDARNSYVEGQSLKNFEFSSNGKTKYIIRTVPINGANSNIDEPMKLGFNPAGNNNFTISSNVANQIAEARRGMTEEDIRKEKELLDKTDGLTAEDITFLKRFNTITYGNIEGRVLGLSPYPRFIPHQTVSVSGKVPPAGIVATYENPKVTFFRNYEVSETDSTKEATKDDKGNIIADTVVGGKPVFVEYNRTISTDDFADQSIPENPTREGYKFIGWASTNNATEPDFVANANVVDDKEYYAIWTKVNTVTFKTNDGTDTTHATVKVENEKAISTDDLADESMPADPTRDGYVFKGWATDAGATASDFNGDTVVSEDKTVYAIWVKKGTITVKHQDEEDNKISDDSNLEGEDGREFSIDEIKKDIFGYIFKVVKEGSEPVTMRDGEDQIIVLTYALKDAKAKYEFNSATANKELPEAVTNLLPQEQNVKYTREITATQPAETSVVVDDGTWTFNGYDGGNARTVDEDVETFVGKWTFEPKPARTAYEFKNAVADKELPDSVTSLLPTSDDVKYGDEITAKQPTKINVPVNDGVWTFTGYGNDNPRTVDEDIETFVGTWNFTAKKANTAYQFRSLDDVKTELPDEVKTLLPTSVEVNYGDEITATQPAKTNVEASDGTWTFEGYDGGNTRTVDEDVETFVGAWNFQPKLGVIKYTFVSADDSKELPREVLELKPRDNEEPKTYGTRVEASQPERNTVDVEDGIWTFEGYNKNEKVIDSEEFTFVGTWRYAKKLKLTFVFRSSLTNIPELPQEVKDLTPEPKVVAMDDKVKDHLVEPAQLEVIAPAKSDEGDIAGKWVFEGYRNVGDERTVQGDEIVEGNWTFYPEYNVTYSFVNALDQTASLPAKVMEMLPANSKVYSGGKVAPPWFVKEIKDEDNRGKWEFFAWMYDNQLYTQDMDSVTVNNNVEFVGKWRYTRGYIVSWTHKSVTEGKEFPFEEFAKKALVSEVPERYIEEGGTITTRTQSFADITTDDGTWIYLDRETEFRFEDVREDKNLIARWQFVPNKVDEPKDPENPDTPDNPQNPDNPNVPDNPSKPTDPVKPVDPIEKPEEPKEPEKPVDKPAEPVKEEVKKENKKVPTQTGDVTDIEMLITTMALTGLLGGALVLRRRRED